jgi:hypothetical protein
MPWLPWALYALSFFCFVIVFRTHSLFWGGLGLLVALASMVWATLALMQARIESRSQNIGTLLGPEELARLRAQAEAKRSQAAASGQAAASESESAAPGA